LNFLEIWQNWRTDVDAWLRHEAPKALLILLVAILLTRLLRRATDRLVRYSERQALPSGLRARQMRTLAEIFYSLGALLIVFLAALQVLPLFGLDMKPLLASAGIAGIAVGFGAQTLVKDVINGFFILLEDQYELGDMVRAAGVEGTVEGMSVRRTLLRGGDGVLHIVPNSEMRIVSNLTRDWRLGKVLVPVAYGEDSGRVLALLKDVGQKLRADPEFADAISADPAAPVVERIAAGHVDYLVQVRVHPDRRESLERELRRRIKEALEQQHIQAPVRQNDGGRAPREEEAN
jgi:small conductance mechanosensitive channel